jgi:hypothetical protein
MWRVVYIAKKREQAEAIRTFLQKEGFLADIKALDISGFEISVPASEAEEVADILHNYRCGVNAAAERG